MTPNCNLMNLSLPISHSHSHLPKDLTTLISHPQHSLRPTSCYATDRRHSLARMANHSFNTVAKKLNNTETQYDLARPQPQLESDLKQYQRSHAYGRPNQDTTSAASQITPPRIAYDVVFTTLRLVVARVNPISTTPIAYILRGRLSDAEICELVRDLCGDGGSKLPSRPHTTAQPRLDPRKGKALRTMIDEARVAHAMKLAMEQLVDVDIIYKCSQYQVEPFRSDKDLLAARVRLSFMRCSTGN